MNTRKNAKEELGVWFAEQIKENVAVLYRFFRKMGLRAMDAIEIARTIVQDDVDQFIRGNFHSHVPVN